MGAFDRFYKKEPLIRKTIEIDDSLYNQLGELAKNKYDTSVNMLINASIEELIKTENINYQKENKEYAVKHSLLIRKSFVIGLDNLKDKYNISIYKLVNMAIRNALNELA